MKSENTLNEEIKILKAEIKIKEEEIIFKRNELRKLKFKTVSWDELTQYLKDNPKEDKYDNPIVYCKHHQESHYTHITKDGTLQLGAYYSQDRTSRGSDLKVFKDMRSWNFQYHNK